MDDLLSSTSHVLSETSRHIGFAIAPANEHAVFQRIEFVPLSGNRILVVMVARGNQVSQKTVDIGEGVSAVGTGAGRQLPELRVRRPPPRRCARRRASTRLREERTLYDQLLGLALRLASQTLENLRGPDGRLHRGRVHAARAGRAGQRHLRDHAAARCCGWSKRSSGWCGC